MSVDDSKDDSNMFMIIAIIITYVLSALFFVLVFIICTRKMYSIVTIGHTIPVEISTQPPLQSDMIFII